MSVYKRLYDSMLKNGELQELFPEFTLDWKKDKTMFIQQQQELENMTKEMDIYLNFEEDDYNG